MPVITYAQTWQWAKRMPYEYGSAMTVDRLGNVYVTGQTDTAIYIGFDTFANHGTFVIKYNAFGDSIWSKTFWGGNPRTIATDGYGHIFVGGDYFDTALIWDGHIVRNAIPMSTWATFLAMLDSQGNCIWIRGDSSTSNCSGLKVVVDPNNNVYLSGGALGVVKFGHVTLPHYGSNTNAYLVKYNVSGDVLWAVSGTSGDGSSLAIDKWGNIYQAGYLPDNTISFGSVTCIAEPLPGGNYGGYLVRFDTNGNALWIRARKDGLLSCRWHVALNEQGSVFVASNYDTSFILGTDTLNALPGNSNLALVKFDSSGNILSAKCAGITHFIDPNDISTDKWGNIYIAGYVSPGTTYGTVHFDSISLDCVPYYLPFFVEYNRCGRVEFATVLGNNIRNFGEIFNIISVDSNIYIFGSYGNDGITVGEHILTSNYRTHDCFLAKWKGRGGYPDCWPLAVTEKSSSYDVILFPNPTTSNIIIKSAININNIIVFNHLGNKICGYNYSATNKVELDVSKWLPGRYLVRINDNVTRSFLKD